MSAPIVGERQRPPIVVALGASAGGIDPLLTIVGDLPADLDAAVLVVVHVPSSGHSALPRVMRRHTAMIVSHAVDGEPLTAGRLLIAPPDHHLTIEDSTVLVRRGPAINRARPAIDPLFQSVALHAGERGVGVVLSGALDDGAAGLAAIAEAGGTTIVQDPEDAVYPSMPEAAIDRAKVDHVLAASEIATVIVERSQHRAWAMGREPVAADRLEKEMRVSEMGPGAPTTDQLGARASIFGCPACGGTLWELTEGEGFRFRCRVGHAFSPGTLLEAQGANAEDGLWIAYRALDEQASLAGRLAEQAQTNGQDAAHRRFLAQARTAERHAQAIKELLRSEPGMDRGAGKREWDPAQPEEERAESVG